MNITAEELRRMLNEAHEAGWQAGNKSVTQDSYQEGYNKGYEQGKYR
jgi:flagellar biosynthesis/type III secretory pathway protein FliH